MPVLGVPKTAFSFQGSLEKLRKSVILTVMVYDSERIHIKISKRNRHIG